MSDKPKFDARISHSKGVIFGENVTVGDISFAPSPAEVMAEEAEHFRQLGIRQLECRAYPDATRALRLYLDRAPGDAETHYRLALSLLGGRRPKVLSLGEIRQVEGALEAAIRLQPEEGHLPLFLAFVKYDFYVLNGMRLRLPSWRELLAQAGSCELRQEKLQELFLHTSLSTFLVKHLS